VLEGNTDHLTAEGICDRVRTSMPGVSLATVYNTLRELVKLGEVRELDLGEGKSRYDPDTGPHQHITCIRCHSVVDVQCDTRCLELSEAQCEGYRVLGADVTFYGVCPVCCGQESESWTLPISRVWGMPPTA
jgi:Fe2+ or Zn2+ uptake regulation protein